MKDKKTTKDLQTSWYNLIEDLRSIFIENEFVIRWQLVEMHHTVGIRILEDYHKLKKTKTEFLQDLAWSLGKSERTLRYCIEFARKYPELTNLKEGKNISWTKITKLLDGGEEKEKCLCDGETLTYQRCVKCGKFKKV